MSETVPTPGIHTGPVPPLAAVDPDLILSEHPEIDPGDGCRVCGMTHQHSYGCRLRRPDPAVRVGDTLPDSASKHRPVTRVKRVRDEIFETAAALVSGDREDDYGSAIDNFTAIGKLWAVTFGVDTITPMQVAIALAQLKQARLLTNPYHRDSWVDGTGYMALGGDIAAELEADRRAYEQR